MLKTTLSNTYKKFFEEINLNEDDQEKFNDIIATIKLSEYSNNLKIFDESISIDDLLKEQSQFNEHTDGELIKIIGKENIESFKEFNQKLKTNTVAQQYEVYLQELNISEDLRSNVKQTLYKQIEKNLDPSFGEWTYDDIYNVREKYQGAQMGSKKFFEVSIKHYENKNKPIITSLNNFPNPI